jgi:hypothetical protein
VPNTNTNASVLSRVLAVAALAAGLIAAPAHAFIIVWDLDLTGAQESPPTGSPGTADALITVDTVLNTMRVQTTWQNLLAGTSAAHIHCCTPAPFTGTAGVATTTPTFTGFPNGLTSGTYDNTFNMLATTSYNPAFITAHGGNTTQAWADLLQGMTHGFTYLNIHTSPQPPGFTGGEIRAFLQVAVPEPGTMALLGIAAAGLAWRRRKA